jgi:nucleoside-diphosphate-sugar epimerase
MKIIVTGSTGYVGRHLIPVLLGNGHEILELTRNMDRSLELFGEQTSKFNIKEEQSELKKKIEQFDPYILIHLAAFLSANDDYNTLNKLLDANIFYLCKVLDAVKDSKLKMFINTGTFAEYSKGDGELKPAYLYAATKMASRAFLDYYANIYKFKNINVVPYTIYGGTDTHKKIIDIIIDSIDSNLPIDLTPGEQILDFIHVDDVVDFYLHLVNNVAILPQKENFELGTGKGYTLKELAFIIEQLTGKRTNINWGGKSYRPTDVMYAVANLTNIKKWKPQIDINKGVMLYLRQGYCGKD